MTETDSSSARGLAHLILGDVLDRRQALDDAFSARAAHSSLKPEDLAFARNLSAATLRHLGEIDALIAACLDRPLPKGARAARDALRLGAAQLLILKVEPHAAVNESVELAGRGKFRGLVNAVLRRLSREGATMRAGLDGPRLNTPDWLYSGWRAAYGAETARAIASAHLAEPPLDLTLKSAEDAARWAERLGADRLPTGSLRLRGAGRIPDLEGYAEGAWWVQDAAAALPARLLAPMRGERVLDLCAAPGGKTAQLAALGAEVTALDRSEKRLTRLSDNLKRLGLAARTVAAAAESYRPEAPFPKVLLDAPCSATGTIRRHPDLPHIKRAEDLDRLREAQKRLLAAAAGMVEPGGRLVYAVCSLEPAEGVERIAEFLAARPEFRRLPIAPDEVPGLHPAIAADGDLRTLPCHWAEHGGLDGFFVARLEKRE